MYGGCPHQIHILSVCPVLAGWSLEMISKYQPAITRNYHTFAIHRLDAVTVLHHEPFTMALFVGGEGNTLNASPGMPKGIVEV